MSCPHAHEQNRAAEQKHRHIVEVCLALLAYASIPLKYWEDAFVATTYLINRTPSRFIDYDTSLERLFQQKPDYSSLRVFGCACWPNLRPYNTHKFQFHSTQCVFLGYSPLHKGFKCLDLSTGRVYISRDVTFDENIFPFSKLHPNAGARLRHEISLLSTDLQPQSSDQGGELMDDHTFDTNNINESNEVCAGNDVDLENAGGDIDLQADLVPNAAENESRCRLSLRTHLRVNRRAPRLQPAGDKTCRCTGSSCRADQRRSRCGFANRSHAWILYG